MSQSGQHHMQITNRYYSDLEKSGKCPCKMDTKECENAKK